jgi:hypothetical protein
MDRFRHGLSGRLLQAEMRMMLAQRRAQVLEHTRRTIVGKARPERPATARIRAVVLRWFRHGLR